MAAISRSGERVARRVATAGFGYIALLILLAVMSVSLAAAGSLWSTVARREREADLLFVGAELRRAIVEFHDTTPNGQRPRFPTSFDELLLDPRWPATRRHLRAAYADPMTGRPDWAIVRAPDGGIAGVRSVARGAPMKRSGFGSDDVDFAEATRYGDWYFGYPIEQMPTAGAAAPSPVASGLVLPGFGDAPGGR